MNANASGITLGLHDLRAQEVALCGGKAANLAKLAIAGFAVPQAKIITVDTYQAWFAQLSSAICVGASVATNADELANQCSELREQLVKISLPAEIEASLRIELADLCKQGPVSVRSSATLEDMQGAAFAGQHDTFLGVCGIDQVIVRIVDCYASLWEDRAVRYRYEQGFDRADISMAVVVQRMVSAECAGVAFSAHPITGHTDHVLINASFGLGETVVSGDGEIDQYTVNGIGEIVETHIGQKAQAIYLGEIGPVTAPIADIDQKKPSLDHQQVIEISTLAKLCETHFGFPQDIEWAYDAHGLHLLQSRPISELPARWTRQESAERFPGPITPLTWDFTTVGFHESLRYSLNLMGLPEFNGRWFERFDGFVYGDQAAVELYTAGHQIQFQSLSELEGKIDAFRHQYAWVQELPSIWSCNLDQFLLRLGEFSSTELSNYSNTELWQRVAELEQAGNEYFLPNIAISITQGLLHRTLYKLVVLVCGEHAPIVYDDLTCYCDTKTARVNRDLFSLYQLVLEEPGLRSLLQVKDRRKLYESGNLRSYNNFYSEYTKFISAHGHREVEFDAYYPTWNKQPWVVLENLRLMLMNENIKSPVDRDRELRSRQHRSELKFLAKLPESLKGFAKELIQLSRTYTALDDVEHYHTTRLSVPFREMVMELGSRFVNAGVTKNADDLFFLSRESVTELVNKEVDLQEIASTIQANKQLFIKQKTHEPPYELGEYNEQLNSDLLESLVGLPGSPGVVQGRTCVIRSSDDFAAFKPGSILVARTTNPAWTPLFYAASAVITESGGPLSHGAVTAREIGIPAVVAAKGAINALGDDMSVRVNGGAGAVTLLD